MLHLVAMVDDIRKHLANSPFVPFRVRMADGHEYPVPTLDHIYLPPGDRRVIISDDAGIAVMLPALLVSGLLYADDSPTPSPAA